MLDSPCNAVRHGDGSVNDLAKAYVYNTGCVVKHQILLQELDRWVTLMNKNNKEE